MKWRPISRISCAADGADGWCEATRPRRAASTPGVALRFLRSAFLFQRLGRLFLAFLFPLHALAHARLLCVLTRNRQGLSLAVLLRIATMRVRTRSAANSTGVTWDAYSKSESTPCS